MKFITFFSAIGLALILLLIPPSASAQSIDPIYTSKFSNTAVGGYDPVAYFTEGEPVKGSTDYQLEHKGARFLFSSQENFEAFVANPTKYAPQYGGYCAWAVAHNKTARGNPKNWTIVDGKLYLNINDRIENNWKANQAEFIKAADKNWPKLVK